MNSITIATRTSKGWCPTTGQQYTQIDRLVREGRRFFLILGAAPGGREVVRPISLRFAYRWLRKLSDQITRAVIVGGLAA
jgi:hypothetical protein